MDGRINASNPCSEYMFLDDTACNLSSLNLTKFLDAEGRFDVEGYRPAFEMLASRRWPFDELPRQVVGLEEAASLLSVMAGDEPNAMPPVHGVVTPSTP